jgi:hypothetical protein
MPRIRNTVSGVEATVSEETAALLDSEWERVDDESQKRARAKKPTE